MASLQTPERRILAREALYELQRSSVRTDLRLAKLMSHLQVADVTDDEVDAVLDQD